MGTHWSVGREKWFFSLPQYEPAQHLSPFKIKGHTRWRCKVEVGVHTHARRCSIYIQTRVCVCVCVQKQKSHTHACPTPLLCVALRAPIVRLADFNLCSLPELSWGETVLLTSFWTLQQQGVAWGNRGQGGSLVEMSTADLSACMLEVEVHRAENYYNTDKAIMWEILK